MEIALLILSFLLMLLGIVGSVLPVLPGPQLSWVGLLVFFLPKSVPTDRALLIVTFVIALVIFILDYVIPALGTKKLGGTRYGMVGATLGLVVGLFSPIPLGIVVGAFLGALLGEILSKSSSKNALSAAFGSFLGLLASTFMKLFVSFVFLGIFCWLLVKHWGVFF